MKDLLQDIVSHTHKLGFLNIVKITGDDKTTKIDTMADNRTVVMFGETKDPQPEFIGTFGMPQLNKLSYLLECPEYQEGETINLVVETRNGKEDIPTGLLFENAGKDFKNTYNFMNTDVINEKIKTTTFRGVKWDVEIAPSVASIQRFQFQAGANPEHTTFLAKTDGDKLKFSFGNAGSDNGEFVFATGVTGILNKSWTWPVTPILSILKIADVNNTKMRLSNEAALEITLDSGLATYQYIIPAQT